MMFGSFFYYLLNGLKSQWKFGKMNVDWSAKKHLKPKEKCDKVRSADIRL